MRSLPYPLLLKWYYLKYWLIYLAKEVWETNKAVDRNHQASNRTHTSLRKPVCIQRREKGKYIWALGASPSCRPAVAVTFPVFLREPHVFLGACNGRWSPICRCAPTQATSERHNSPMGPTCGMGSLIASVNYVRVCSSDNPSVFRPCGRHSFPGPGGHPN